MHSNATGGTVGNENVDRVDIYAPLDGRVHDLAKKMADRIHQVMGTKQGGFVKTRAGSAGNEYYGVLRGAVSAGVPGLLVEHSFHTCTRSAEWLLNEANLEKLAKAEAEVLADYYGLSGADQNELTAIEGTAQATARQMISYIKKIKPETAQWVIDMIPLYLTEGAAEGIRGDIAFAQSCLETGNFLYEGSAVTPDQNNFCGLGVTSNGVKGNAFATPQMGIRAQIQHLKAYANKEALVNECIDPRFKYVTRGSAQYVEWLGVQENPNGKGWAGGANYGNKIIAILNKILLCEGGMQDETPADERMLQMGDEGDDVAGLQEMLKELGYDLGKTGANKDGVDGDFGKKTDKAVRDVQTKAGLKVDGVADSKTYAALQTMLTAKRAKWRLTIEGEEAVLRKIYEEHGGELVKVEGEQV